MSLLRRVVIGRRALAGPLTRPIETLLAWAMVLVSIGACSSTEPQIPTSVALNTNSLSLTALGQEEQLTAAVTDLDGTVLDDVTVRWSSSNAAVATVTQNGLVTAQGAGSAEITAAAGAGSASAQVTVVQTPAQLQKISGDGQAAPAGATLPAPLVLQVNDSRGNPIPGVTVSFTVSQGDGSISTSTVTTGTDGRASTNFTNGTISDSPQEISAAVPSTTVSVSFTARALADPSAYNIGIRFLDDPTPAQRQAFTDARLRWEAVITQDVEAGLLQEPAGETCGEGWPAVDQSIDDLMILVRLVPIDGEGGVLGGAGPCWIRDPSSLTILGGMQFDTDDLEAMEAEGILSNVILHEMGHVLGFGTLWGPLLVGPSLPPDNGPDPHFTGAQAIAAFDNVGGTGYGDGAKVPVENTGGESTADGHWRESVFGNELMTGFISAGPSPLSAVSIASLGDLGYGVNLARADSYSLMLSLRAFSAQPKVRLVNDILKGPIRKVDSKGRATGEFRR